MQAAGSIGSSTSDMLKYANACLGNAPATLNKDILLTQQVTYTEGPTKIGLGWHYIKPGSDEIIFHNGQTGGYHGYLAMDREKKFAVVILSNCALGTEEIGATIIKWLEK